MSWRKKHKNRAVWKIFRKWNFNISPPLTHITDWTASKAQHSLFSRFIASFADIFRLKRCHNAPRRVDLPHSSFSTNTWGLFFPPSGWQIRVSLTVDHYCDLPWRVRRRCPPQGGRARPLSRNRILFVFSSTLWPDQPDSSRHGTCINSIH